MDGRQFLSAAAAGTLAGSAAVARPATRRPNLLMVLADDMNFDTPGCFGGRVAGLTPNIDALAREGMRFRNAHVSVAVCMPSRTAMLTGLMPVNNGTLSVEPIRDGIVPLPALLHAAGYRTGILGKNDHLQPEARFAWDLSVRPQDLGEGRAPDLYGARVRDFLAQAKAGGQPFFLMANSHDPHRPFAGSADEQKAYGRHMPVSRTIGQAEATVPGFLPDLPPVREEVAQYLTSAHRCDETIGRVLRALEESGMADNTLVLFLSDNGMAFPFAKANCYLNSTHSPWIARWPDVVRAGGTSEAFVAGIDIMPTFLEAAGLNVPGGLDGRSFLPVLKGAARSSRDHVTTAFHATVKTGLYEMRCLQDGRWGYIWNAWSDGKTVYSNESQQGMTWKAMKASTDPQIAARAALFEKRVPEELYDFAADPDGLVNLANDPRHKAKLAEMRRRLAADLGALRDPLAPRLAALA